MNSSVGVAVARTASTSPSVGCSAAIGRRRAVERQRRLARRRRPSDQVLRNQSCGSRCIGAASGPRLCTRDRASGCRRAPALAYSTNDVEVAVVVEDAGVEQLELGLVACRGGGSPRPVARTETRAADTCRASSGTSASAWRRGSSSSSLTSSPWLPSPLVRPNSRSLRIGSRPFHSASAKQRRCSSSRDAGDAVLAPAIGAAAGVVVREVVPGVAVRAVVLAHRAPLALAQVRPPRLPALAVRVLGQTLCFARPRRARRVSDASFCGARR